MLFQRYDGDVHWFQLGTIDDLVASKVVDSCVADEIEVVAEDCASRRIADEVGSIFENFARSNFSAIRRKSKRL